jgi:hypothetical protein
MKYIGVGSATILRPSIAKLKRYALLFDKFELLGAKTDRFAEDVAGVFRGHAELSFLEEAGLLSFCNHNVLDEADTSLWTSQEVDSFVEDVKKYLDHTMVPVVGELKLASSKGMGVRSEGLKRWNASHGMLVARFLGAVLRRFGTNATCIETHFGMSVDRQVTRSGLYEIIIDGVPIPDEVIPWEDLLSFRSEDRSQQQLRALRLWVSEMANGKLTYAEAADKIEYLKEEYRSHMKGAGINAGTSVLKTVVVATAELIENALKFKLKEVAEMPFKLFSARGELLEAERKAPGRELAYIVRASDEFKGR